MKILRVLLLTLALPLTLSPTGAQQTTDPSPLVLPPVHYAVVGIPTVITFRNARLLPPGQAFQFTSFECSVGKVDASNESWQFTPAPSDVGDHPLLLRSGDQQASTIIRVIPRDAGAEGKPFSILIVGDSLTNASAYPNQIAHLLSQPGNPPWKLLGSHRPASAREDVAHEGYGGWTWNRFNTRWEPSALQTGKTRSSPFLFLNDGEPHLDITRYFKERCQNTTPDFVTFLLGINDCFHANPEAPAAIEAKIDSMFTEAEKLLTAFRTAAPEADIGICLTPAPNDRDAAFVANYKDRYTREGWRKIQFRLVQRQLEHFGNREDENLFIIPTSSGIDPLAGYPTDNAVHPNESGYRTIGNQIYAWIKWRLAERKP